MTSLPVCAVSRCVLTQRKAPGSTRASAFGGVRLARAVQNGCKVQAFFRLGGTNAKEGGIYGSQGRADYEDIDLEHYFNYVGALATEGTYDRMYALKDSGLDPIDAILILASEENDTPKIEEICEAGADTSVKDLNGKLPVQLATKPETVETLKRYMAKQGVAVPQDA